MEAMSLVLVAILPPFAAIAESLADTSDTAAAMFDVLVAISLVLVAMSLVLVAMFPVFVAISLDCVANLRCSTQSRRYWWKWRLCCRNITRICPNSHAVGGACGRIGRIADVFVSMLA